MTQEPLALMRELEALDLTMQDDTRRLVQAAGTPPPALALLWKRLPYLHFHMRLASERFAPARLMLYSGSFQLRVEPGRMAAGANLVRAALTETVVLAVWRLLDSDPDAGCNVRGLADALGQPNVVKYLELAFNKIGEIERHHDAKALVVARRRRFRQGKLDGLPVNVVVDRLTTLRHKVIAHGYDTAHKVEPLNGVQLWGIAFRIFALGAAVLSASTTSALPWPSIWQLQREANRNSRTFFEPELKA